MRPVFAAARSARTVLAFAGLAGLAAAFGWNGPGRDAWAAGALLAALVLDAASLAATAMVARRRGPAPPMEGLPSVVLAFGPGAGFGTLVFAAALMVWPAGFALMASALAGLVAMGAVARLALARIVMRLESPADLTGS